MELVGKIIDEDGRCGALEKGIHEEQSCTGPRQPREANSAATAHVGDTGMCQVPMCSVPMLKGSAINEQRSSSQCMCWMLWV